MIPSGYAGALGSAVSAYRPHGRSCGEVTSNLGLFVIMANGPLTRGQRAVPSHQGPRTGYSESEAGPGSDS